MSQDQSRALLEGGEEQGCINLSAFEELVGEQREIAALSLAA